MPITLIVEDGTGVAAANCYTDVAYVTTYHDDHGQGAAWAAFNAEKQKACIIRATDYVEKRFGHKYRGRKLNRNQGLEWPRADAWDDSKFLYSADRAIPPNLKKAIAEYALRAGLVGELAPDPVPMVPRQDLTVASPTLPEKADPIGPVRRVSNKVDKLEETLSFATPEKYDPDGGIPSYPAADMLMTQVIRSTQNRTLNRG